MTDVKAGSISIGQIQIAENARHPATQKIIVHLMGGLGNQMFIYAAAMSLARRLAAQMELDTVSGFRRDNKYRREYILDQFAVTAQATSDKEHFIGLRGRTLWRIMLKAEQLHLGGQYWAIITEASLMTRHHAQKLYLFGYWQSEDYFNSVADIIREEFRVRVALPQMSCAELEAIQAQEEPVAVGIRMFNERPTYESAYTTELEFYHSALQRLAEQIPRAHIFVFTENPDWVRVNLRCPLPHTFISYKHENRRACEDLTLMRACRHFVIGNSTYHWWGAWLGERLGSQIFVDSRFAEANPRFYPARWHRL